MAKKAVSKKTVAPKKPMGESPVVPTRGVYDKRGK